MEILNTIIGTEIMSLTIWSVVFIVSLVIGAVAVAFGLEEDDGGIALFGIFFIVFAGLILLFAPFSTPTGKFNPTRFEVKITDPNYVIDAQKYKVVGKRGEIIILEEVKLYGK